MQNSSPEQPDNEDFPPLEHDEFIDAFGVKRQIRNKRDEMIRAASEIHYSQRDTSSRNIWPVLFGFYVMLGPAVFTFASALLCFFPLLSLMKIMPFNWSVPVALMGAFGLATSFFVYLKSQNTRR